MIFKFDHSIVPCLHSIHRGAIERVKMDIALKSLRKFKVIKNHLKLVLMKSESIKLILV